MAAYAEFARFYDEIMGDRAAEIERFTGYIRRFRPGAASLLELGCGTGTILAGLAAALRPADLTLAGVDKSPEMLSRAVARLPAARLVRSDITEFALGARYDVVLCVFDTLNHLPEYNRWLALFDRVREHIADGGLFIFDVNTVGRMRGLWHSAAFAQDFGRNTVIMDITPGGGDLSRWEVKIFELLSDGRFRLHREVIPELAVPLDRIRTALADDFELLQQEDLDGGEVSDDSSRAFFAYQRRPGQPQPIG